MKNSYVIEYLNENEFRKKERAVKKYNMLAYKKLVFDFYPSFRDGEFRGVVTSKNTKDGITKYELKLPTDRMFAKVHGDVVLHYTVYENQKIVMLDTLTPEDILNEGHQKELSTYKGVMVSKSHADRDMFKINLLNMLDKNLELKTNEISKALGRGKHTTRCVTLYEIEDSLVADTPGFSSVDFRGMEKIDIRDNMKEMFDNLDKCKYRDCMHIKEDECEVKRLVAKGQILTSRYENYKSFIGGK